MGAPEVMSDRAVQVAPEHYDFERYDDAERWMSYWHQLRAVLAVRPKTVLEIGPGSGVFRNYLRAAGGEPYGFADGDRRIAPAAGVLVIRMPEHYGALSPILHVLPLQLLAYHTALARGTDVDKPRNLAKSVTVE